MPFKNPVNQSSGKALKVYNSRDLGPTGVDGDRTLNPAPLAPGLHNASGGTLVSPNPGGMELRHFPSPGTFTYSNCTPTDVMQVFVVAGGGAGGFGGGGGGGIAYAYNLPATIGPQTYPVGVGEGGTSRANGDDSTFAGHPVGTITASGGGGNTTPQGPNSNQRQGSAGGSGGGAGHSGPTNPTGGATNQPTHNPGYSWPGGALYQYGQPGGAGDNGPSCCEGGGGGGACGPTSLTAPLPATYKESGTFIPTAAKNQPGDGNGGGDGGNGIKLGWIPTGLGDSGYFGGGGGGAYCPPGGGGQGGGGGGTCPGGSPDAGEAGTANTGGGGGAKNGASNNGGDGIVLVYYLAP